LSNEILEPMTEEELQAWVKSTLDDAIDYIDNDVSNRRVVAQRFFLGKPFSESDVSPYEEKGRSQVVSRDVFDAVNSMVPSLMRVFFSGEQICEFVPRGPEDVQPAKQATDLANWFLEQSDAYGVFGDAIKDMLISGTGILKIYYDKTYNVESRRLSGLNEMQINLFLQEGYEVTSSTTDEETGLIDVHLTRKTPNGQIKMECLPGEEFLINRTAKSVEDATIVAHRMLLRVSDLVELGYDYEEVVEYGGTKDHVRNNSEWLLRHPAWKEDEDTSSDPAGRFVHYAECFCRVDQDGDGVRELRRICTIGSAHEVLSNEVVTDTPFLLIRYDARPHTWEGLSVYDALQDIQRVKSAVMRNVLDSLSLSTRPRIMFNENYIDWDQLSQDKIGSLINVRGDVSKALQMLTMPFVGQQAFPLIQYLDQIKEERVGVGRASQGLELEHLQSTSAVGLAASQKAAQSRLELVARNVAESGFKPLYKKLLNLALTYMTAEPILMRLRGQYIPVDPSTFSDYDVRISLSLDSNNEKRTQTLLALLAKQEQIISQFGPMNPICSVQNYYQTLQRLLQEQGLIDGARYLRSPEEMQQMLQQQMQQAQQQQQPKPSPEEILAQSEIQKTQFEMQQKAEEMRRKDDLERDKFEAKTFLDIQELQLKYNTQIDAGPLVQAVNRNRELERMDMSVQEQIYQQQQQVPNA